MMYLENRSGQQSVYIPRKGSERYSSTLTLTLTSTVNGPNWKAEIAVQDESTSPLYYLVTFELPLEVQAGEHEYRLIGAEGDVIASGMCMIWPSDEGPYGLGYKQYEGDPVAWKQYNN